MHLDSIDKKILGTIQHDSRISVVELAERVGLSPTPCARRLQRLERDGVIRGYVAALDQTQVGLPVNAFIFIKLERQLRDNLTQFEIRIKDLPEVAGFNLGKHWQLWMGCFIVALVVFAPRGILGLLAKLFKRKGGAA